MRVIPHIVRDYDISFVMSGVITRIIGTHTDGHVTARLTIGNIDLILKDSDIVQLRDLLDEMLEDWQ